MLRKVLRRCMYVVQFGCVSHCVLEYVGTVMQCSGPSMHPSLQHSDWILTECFTVQRQKVQKGDIVIAISPENPSLYICKRVTGMDGDKMASTDGSRTVVPMGHVWLEGDNKDKSHDSRSYGPVPYGLLRSRVFMKFITTEPCEQNDLSKYEQIFMKLDLATGED